MNWFNVAQRDYNIYKDKSRTATYVENKKITPEQYEQITGEVYVG